MMATSFGNVSPLQHLLCKRWAAPAARSSAPNGFGRPHRTGYSEESRCRPLYSSTDPSCRLLPRQPRLGENLNSRIRKNYIRSLPIGQKSCWFSSARICPVSYVGFCQLQESLIVPNVPIILRETVLRVVDRLKYTFFGPFLWKMAERTTFSGR